MTYHYRNNKQLVKAAKAVFTTMENLPEFSGDAKIKKLRAAYEIATIFAENIKEGDFTENKGEDKWFQDLLSGRIHTKEFDKTVKTNDWDRSEPEDFENEDYCIEKSYLHGYDENTFPDYKMGTYARVKELCAETSFWN